MANFIFLEIVEMKPRIVCGCQSVSLAISAAVAPSLRLSNSITAPFFDPSRASGFRGLAAGLDCFAAVCFRLAGAVFAVAGFSLVGLGREGFAVLGDVGGAHPIAAAGLDGEDQQARLGVLDELTCLLQGGAAQAGTAKAGTAPGIA